MYAWDTDFFLDFDLPLIMVFIEVLVTNISACAKQKYPPIAIIAAIYGIATQNKYLLPWYS